MCFNNPELVPYTAFIATTINVYFEEGKIAYFFRSSSCLHQEIYRSMFPGEVLVGLLPEAAFLLILLGGCYVQSAHTVKKCFFLASHKCSRA